MREIFRKITEGEDNDEPGEEEEKDEEEEKSSDEEAKAGESSESIDKEDSNMESSSCEESSIDIEEFYVKPTDMPFELKSSAKDNVGKSEGLGLGQRD